MSQIKKSMDQIIKKLNNFVKENKWLGIVDIRQLYNLRRSALKATNSLPSLLIKLRLQGNSAAAELIEQAYQRLLSTVDPAELQKDSKQSKVPYFELNGEGGLKDCASNLAETVHQVAEELEDELPCSQKAISQ